MMELSYSLPGIQIEGLYFGMGKKLFLDKHPEALGFKGFFSRAKKEDCSQFFYEGAGESIYRLVFEEEKLAACKVALPRQPAGETMAISKKLLLELSKMGRCVDRRYLEKVGPGGGMAVTILVFQLQGHFQGVTALIHGLFIWRV
ncbi:MAG: hypothetical protein KDK99_18685, partial [Verrucomicrobiales bacterium]|nr:hypothetical protein [Verrucomicrobiales bacterium]